MLRAGIFLDIENLSRNGGWGMRYDIVRQLAEAQGTTVLRANAYLAVDVEREDQEEPFRVRNEEFRNAIRRGGFHLVHKPVQRYRNAEGETIVKANADLDLAVDALLQAENLDYVLLGTGDGDFLRLVRALQNRGRRVDLLSFAHTSKALRLEADFYFSGFLVPGLARPMENPQRKLGIMYGVSPNADYGFLMMRTGLAPAELQTDIFIHIKDFRLNGMSVDNARFAQLKTRETIVEFDLVPSDRGFMAVNATEFVPRP